MKPNMTPISWPVDGGGTKPGVDMVGGFGGVQM